MHPVGALTPNPAQPPRHGGDSRLEAAARKLESAFLAQMLKSAGLDQARESFGGGPGEAQFASVLRNAQAEAITESGGIGLAEHLFEALKERADG